MKKQKIKSISSRITRLVAWSICYVALASCIGSAVLLGSKMMHEKEHYLKLCTYAIVKETAMMNAENTKAEVITELLKEFKAESEADVTVFAYDTRVFSTLEGAVGTKMDATIWKELQKGEPYFSKKANVNDMKYYAYYEPVIENGECVGAIFAGQLASEVDNTIMVAMANTLMIGVIAGCVFVTIAMKISRRMALKLNRLREVIGTLTANDLTVNYPKYDKLRDEIEVLSNETVDFTLQLRGIMGGIKDASEKLNVVSNELEHGAVTASSTSEEISYAVQNIAEGAESQSKDTQDITERMAVIAKGMDTLRESMGRLSDTMGKVTGATKDSVTAMGHADAQTSEIIKEVGAVNNQIDLTSQSMENIRRMVDVIKDIATQTNLLSLNASIESARAGEAGRGFAVVANEIRKLAEQSATSAQEIESTIANLTENYDLIVQKMTATTESMGEQRETIRESKERFTELDTDVKMAVGDMETVIKVAHDLEEMKDNIMDAICNLSAIGEENSASTEETTASMQELNSIIAETSQRAKEVEEKAKVLMEGVGVFKI